MSGVRLLDSVVVTLSASSADLKHHMQYVQKSLVNCLLNTTSEKSVKMASTVSDNLDNFYTEMLGKQFTAKLDSINVDNVSPTRECTTAIKSINNCSSSVPKLVEQVSSSELNEDHSIDSGSEWTLINRKDRSPVTTQSEATRKINYLTFRSEDNVETTFKASSEFRTWHFKIGHVFSRCFNWYRMKYLTNKGMSALSIEVLNGKKRGFILCTS